MKISISQQRRTRWFVSGLLVLLSIICMAISWGTMGSPLRPGLDFVGGTRLQLEQDCAAGADCSQPLTAGAVREVLAQQGLEKSTIQILGTDQRGMSIQTPSLNVDQRTELETALSEQFGPFDVKQSQIDTVGPVLGSRLLVSGLLSLLLAFAGIFVYLTLRFQMDYAVLAIIALFHDVFITAGVFSALGLIQGLEIDTLFIVSLLTIAGFSVNDTVVIYDRIREIGKTETELPIGEAVDTAVNQTLGRSINTTLTTLLPLISIFFLGGATLRNFALALIVGFVLGAYSSIFVASSLLGWWREFRNLPLAIPSTIVKASTRDQPLV